MYYYVLCILFKMATLILNLGHEIDGLQFQSSTLMARGRLQLRRFMECEVIQIKASTVYFGFHKFSASKKASA